MKKVEVKVKVKVENDQEEKFGYTEVRCDQFRTTKLLFRIDNGGVVVYLFYFLKS